MYQDIRKKLKSIDISCYASELTAFEEKLHFRELSKSTIKNYLANLKIIFGLEKNRGYFLAIL